MRRCILPGALLLLLVLAGCGGGGNSGGGEPATLSRAQYVEQANASCRAAEKTLGTLGNFTSLKELRQDALAGRDAIQKSADELRALRPPRELAPGHARLVDLTEQTAEIAGRLAEAAAKNDQLELEKQAERADKVTVSTNEQARKLGLDDCVAGRRSKR